MKKPINYQTFEGIEQIPLTEIEEGLIMPDKDAYEIAEPGIIGLHCLATDCTFITAGSNISSLLLSLKRDMYSGLFVEELENYGMSSFIILILARGEEWRDFEKRFQEKQHLKKIWPHRIY